MSCSTDMPRDAATASAGFPPKMDASEDVTCAVAVSAAATSLLRPICGRYGADSVSDGVSSLFDRDQPPENVASNVFVGVLLVFVSVASPVFVASFVCDGDASEKDGRERDGSERDALSEIVLRDNVDVLRVAVGSNDVESDLDSIERDVVGLVSVADGRCVLVSVGSSVLDTECVAREIENV